MTMVPLASDLKILKNYLSNVANTAVEQLTIDGNNCNAYTTLLESIFCRVLLLNRRRPGELQRLELHLYNKCMENAHNYEELSDVVTSAEKILLQRFERVVIR